MKRHGVQAKICSQHSGWRRRLQALLGRGMADDETSGCQTGGTAGIPRSPTRAGTRRDAIRRRAIRDAIRRRTIRHTTIISCPEMPGNARNMFGLCSVIPDDVGLLGLSGDRVPGCERPNACFQRRRWRPPETGTSAGTPRRPKIAPSSGAAPAASAAKQCWAALSNLIINLQ